MREYSRALDAHKSVRTLERIASPIVMPMVPPSNLNFQCQYLHGEKKTVVVRT